MYDTEFISLSRLSNRLGLPEAYLKNLAASGTIPSLNINDRLRFNPEAVRQALDRLAEQEGHDEQ